ncbi:MAG TPA: TetR/AcrR family transcriptional regulator [Bacteroidales bacterium]|nr:TetR/AcrR family transcriptional regulator [Bacteroidales bacterium]
MKIFFVAFKLFLQKGFKEVTMNEILEQSGLSRGTFYYYFKSKEKIYEEVINTFYLSVPATTQLVNFDGTLYDFYHVHLENASRSFARLGQTFADAKADVFSYFALSLDALKRLPGFREKMKFVNDGVLNNWIHVIKTARENGEISTGMTDEQIACFFKFTMEGMGMKSTLEGKSSEENDRELITLWDNFYNHIKARH